MPSAEALALGLAWLAALGLVPIAAASAPGHRALPYLIAHAAMTAVMLLAWRRLRSPRDLALVLAVGVLGRVALVPVASFTTTDVARYLWDGAVTLDGRDPYALAPMAAELASLRGRFPMPVDHRDVATCYPPLALALFALAAATGPARAWWTWKFFTAAASVAVPCLAWWHLRGSERARHVTLAAWSPLLVLEAGVGAHLDVFAALAVTAAVVSYERRRRGCAALAAGVAAAVKLLPGVVVLALVARTERPLRVVALAAAPLVLSFGVAEALGMTPPGSLPHVAAHWSFASPLWSLTYALAPLDDETTRPLLAAAGLVAMALVALRPGALARNVRDVLGAMLATVPVLYPWYLSASVAAAPFAPAAWVLTMAAVAPFSYEVLDAWQARGVWSPAAWPVVALGVAAVVAVVADVRAWWRQA